MSAIRIRLFLTCWMVYVAHFATDFVREHYLVVSIVEDHAYRLDKYYGLHVDIFRNPPEAKVQGAHHGANPGISMLAAIPYAVTRPVVDWIVNRELAARKRAGGDSAVYRDPRPRRVEFYRVARARGLDIRFGLVGAITMALCMAPLTAASVVLMFGLLGAIGLSQRRSLWLSLLYAFGTPVFFRTGYLNQNLALGLAEFWAFAILWNPRQYLGWRLRTRLVVAGLLGGFAFLCDYSGAILMGLLGFYAWWRAADELGVGRGFRQSLWYVAGAAPGILLLWQYQWASFGNPFLPPQNWMAPVEWIDVGYKGVGGFSPELFAMLFVDPSFGLFVAMPLSVLAFVGPWLAWRGKGPVPFRESMVAIGLSLAMIVFFSTVQYTRLQWVTGIRYLAPLFPFLFLAAVPVLLRLPRLLGFFVVTLSLVVSWSIAMVRSQGTVFENVKRAMLEGFQLPWLTVLSKMTAYLPNLSTTPSALPSFALLAVMILFVWRVRHPWSRPTEDPRI